MKKSRLDTLVSDQQLEREFRRTVRRKRRCTVVNHAIAILTVFAAFFVLVTTMWFPIYYVTGTFMEPTLERGMVVVASRILDPVPGDIVAMNDGNRVLLSRLIAVAGDSVSIDRQGNVSVNNTALREAYLNEKNLGTTDLMYPYQVPKSSYFLMGDNRAKSIDSRISAIGCIQKDAFAGKIMFCIWPISRIGYVG